jgi:hypothetical protein
MEALAVLSLTCNIFQLISACKETADMLTKIRKKGSLDLPLSGNAAQIELFSTQVMTSINNGSFGGTSLNVRSNLLIIAQDCKSTAQEIRKVVEEINNSKGGSLGMAYKAMRRKGSLDRLDSSLQRYQQTLQSHTLEDIW